MFVLIKKWVFIYWLKFWFAHWAFILTCGSPFWQAFKMKVMGAWTWPTCLRIVIRTQFSMTYRANRFRIIWIDSLNISLFFQRKHFLLKHHIIGEFFRFCNLLIFENAWRLCLLSRKLIWMFGCLIRKINMFWLTFPKVEVHCCWIWNHLSLF